MSGLLDGKVALITGAGRGIGAVVATLFAGAGASLSLCSRTNSELEKTAAQCRGSGGEVMVFAADVSDGKRVHDLMDETRRRLGGIDVLVNAAGCYGPIGPFAECDPDQWRRAFEVNVMGTFHTCRAALPSMIARRRGKIINFSGGGATSPLPNFSAYGVSKTAVVRLTETIAEEVKAFGIDVNAIAPGLVDTRLQDEILKARERAGPLYERIMNLRRSGEGGVPPEKAAELALFLASASSDGLTGKLISAPYDPWNEWRGRGIEQSALPMYTLRRLDPHTLGPLMGKG